MRRAPLLTLVTPEGVWAYPAGATSSGVALSRQVGGRWLDLFTRIKSSSRSRPAG